MGTYDPMPPHGDLDWDPWLRGAVGDLDARLLRRSRSITEFGAVPGGFVDCTTAIHQALAAGVPVYVPPGTWQHGPLTLPHESVLFGANGGTYNNARDDTRVSRLLLAAGSNTRQVTIPVTANAGQIFDMELDGNKANNTGAGSGIYFAADNAQNEAQWSLRRLFVHDHRGSGVAVDSWRQAVEIVRCKSNFNVQHGFRIAGTDCVLEKLIAGDNTLDGISVEANNTDIWAPALYNNRTGININTTGSAIERVGVSGGQVDKNLRQGVYIGPNALGIDLSGVGFTSNGRETDNTYPHIQVATTTGLVGIRGCIFRDLEPGITNRASYGILLDPVATAKAAANSYQPGAAFNGYTNDITRLAETASVGARNVQTGTAYVLLASDVRKTIERGNSAANTVTVPAGVFADGDEVYICQTGSGITTVVQGAGMTIRSEGNLLSLRGQWAEAVLRFRSGSEAVLSGNLA